MASQRSLFSIFKPKVVNSEAIVRPIVDQIVEISCKIRKKHDVSKVISETLWSWTNLYPWVETVVGENNNVIALKSKLLELGERRHRQLGIDDYDIACYKLQ